MRKLALEVLERLEGRYGVQEQGPPRFDPMDELVSCILSQHTTDATSFPTFHQLKARYPSWDQVAMLSPLALAEEIRAAGLANQKAKSILRALAEIHDRTGAYDLSFLGSMEMRDARAWLESLPGVGPKSASIVLCFALGMPALPVDTHVYRVSWRIGFIPESLGEAKAHDAMLGIVPPELVYRFHMILIQHGRQVCKAPLPVCEACVVTDLCRWFRRGGPQRKRREMARARVMRAKKGPK